MKTIDVRLDAQDDRSARAFGALFADPKGALFKGAANSLTGRRGGIVLHEFSYEAPSTIEQALGLLAAERDGARALCGGTDLLIQMRMGVRSPARLVDIKSIPELRRISFDAKTGLKLGAAVPCIEIFENPLMGKHYP